MKIVEWVVMAALWIAGAVGLIFFGWCLKGYCTKKSIKCAPIEKAEEAVINATDKAFTKKG
jgi:hypothetical protein